MDLFLRVAAPAIDESLQKLVDWLEAHLSLQLMAFFPAPKFGLNQIAFLMGLNVATLLFISHHFRSLPRKTPLAFWRRGLLFTLHSPMWVVNPHDIKYERDAATAILKRTVA